MSNDLANPLPKTLPGWVCRQWVKCGKANCRCARGELHGPYHYRFWREDGRLRKRYVRPDEVKAIRAACQRWRRAEAKRRKEGREFRQLWREHAATLRRAEWLLKLMR